MIDRAISLTQPWASLVVLGIKRVENRRRKLIPERMYNRPIAIHATREIDEGAYERVEARRPDLFAGWSREDEASWPAWYRLTRVTSAILGMCEVTGLLCRQKVPGIVYRDAATGALFDDADQRRWLELDLAYVLAGARSLAVPVQCRGWQGLWHLTSREDREQGKRSAVECAVMRQVSA